MARKMFDPKDDRVETRSQMMTEGEMKKKKGKKSGVKTMMQQSDVAKKKHEQNMGKMQKKMCM